MNAEVEVTISGGKVTKTDNRRSAIQIIIDHARQDTYGERFQNSKGRWGYARKDEALDDERIVQARIDLHLSKCGPHLAVYVMEPGTRTRLAVLDLDDHKGVVPWEHMREAALAIAGELRPLGFTVWPVRSGGGHGIHLYLRWRDPQPAAAVRALLLTALDNAGFEEGSDPDGIAAGKVEVYPKGNTVDPGTDSWLIALPFARASVPLDAEMQPIDVPLPLLDSPPVPALDTSKPREPKGDTVRKGTAEDLAVVIEALEFISPLGHSIWVTVGHAMKNVFGEDGFPAWDDWMRRADPAKHAARETVKRWRGFKQRTNGRRVGLPTIYTLAEAEGKWTRPPVAKSGTGYKVINGAIHMLKETPKGIIPLELCTFDARI